MAEDTTGRRIPDLTDKSPLDRLIMDERRRFMIEVIMLIRYTIRGYFGLKFSNRWGYFLDRHMCAKIRDFSDWIDYPSGDAILSEHTGYVNAVAISKSGQIIFTGSADQSVMMWDLRKRQLIGEPMPHDSEVLCLCCGFGYLISGCSDDSIFIWNAHTQELIGKLEGHSNSINSVSMNKQVIRKKKTRNILLVSSSQDNTMRLWSLKTRECISVLPSHSEPVSKALLIGSILISGSWDKSLRLQQTDIATSSDGTISEGVSISSEISKCVTDKVSDIVTDIAINCDCTLLACLMNRSFVIYHWPSMKVLRTVQNHAYFGDFHPTKPNILAVSSLNENMVKLYNVRTGHRVHQFFGHKDTVKGMVFSPDGNQLISVSADETVRVWRVLDSMLIWREIVKKKKSKGKKKRSRVKGYKLG